MRPIENNKLHAKLAHFRQVNITVAWLKQLYLKQQELKIKGLTPVSITSWVSEHSPSASPPKESPRVYTIPVVLLLSLTPASIILGYGIVSLKNVEE